MKIYSILLFCLCLLSPLAAQNKRIDSLLKLTSALEIRQGDMAADTQLVEVYFSVADVYYDLYNNAEESFYTHKALDLVSKLLESPSISPDLRKILLRKQAKGFGNVGTSYLEKNDFSKALEFYFKALKIDEGLVNTKGIKRHFTNIASVYQKLRDYEKSRDYFLKALALENGSSTPREKASLYQDVGSAYTALNDFQMAMKFYDKAMEISRAEKDTSTIGRLYGNMASTYTRIVTDKLDKGVDRANIPEFYTAVAYYKKALDIYELSGNKRSKAIQLNNLGILYSRMRKHLQAKEYHLEALEISRDLRDPYRTMITNILLSQLSDSLGQHKEALRYYKDHIEAKDSFFNIENAKKNVAAELNYEFEKKKAIQAVEHEKQVISLEAENKIEKNTRNFVILVSVLSLLLAVSGFVYFNNRKALRLREHYAQQLLLSQEKERQRISKELHDSIGQNILFIKNQMIRNNDLRLMTSVDETLEEVRSISKDLYPNQLEKYGLVAAVDALAEKVKSSSNIFVSFDLDSIDKNLSPDRLINYYRIIQECVTNALKHAEASALRISATQTNGQLELVVQDNGKGFDKESLSKKSQRSFGLLNLEERVKHLKGKLILETAPGKGTKYIFSIPS